MKWKTFKCALQWFRCPAGTDDTDCGVTPDPTREHTFEFMDQYADGWGTGAAWELVDTCGNTVAAGPGPSDGYADWISVPFGGAGAACPTCQPVDCAGAWGAWAAAGIPGDSCTWAGDDACDVPGAKVYC